jgi:hypothetical protein
MFPTSPTHVCINSTLFSREKRGSARYLYVVCIYGAICLKIQKYFSPDRAVFSLKYLILILFYVVSRFMQKNSRFHGKIARYDVLKMKIVDISHRRYKPKKDIPDVQMFCPKKLFESFKISGDCNYSASTYFPSVVFTQA